MTFYLKGKHCTSLRVPPTFLTCRQLLPCSNCHQGSSLSLWAQLAPKAWISTCMAKEVLLQHFQITIVVCEKYCVQFRHGGGLRLLQHKVLFSLWNWTMLLWNFIPRQYNRGFSKPLCQRFGKNFANNSLWWNYWFID